MTTTEKTSHVSEPSPFYVLAIAIVLASLLLSVSVYFSADTLARTIEQKPFTVVMPTMTLSPVLNLTLPSSGAAAPTAPQPAPQAAAPAAQNGCGTGSGSGAAATARVDVSGLTVKGDANAKVTIVEFSDFQCPYCVRVQPTIAQLLRDYAGQVDVVHVNYVVHPTAKTAHTAVLCAGDQNKYWEMHDQIFSTQTTDEAGLQNLAQGMGLDRTKFNACMTTGKESVLSAQMALGRSIGVGGTPSFVIGKRSGNMVEGQMIVGAQGISAFKTAINSALNN